MDTITKRAAKAAGLNYYFTGKPCSKGHIAKRHLTGTCSECQQIANRGWAQRNPGEAARRSREWVAANRDRSRAIQLRAKRKAMRIPDAPYPKPECCENCGRKPFGINQMHLDHDHVTGKFRGWLCGSCNRGIGMLGDDIAGVERAIAYLKRGESGTSS